MAEYLFDVTQGQVVYIERCFTDSTGLGTAVSSGSACVKRMSDQVLGPGCTAITTSGGLTTLSVTTGSSSTFYVKGDYSVYMGAGTVGGVSVIGYTLAQFSIGKLTAFTFSTNVLQWLGTSVTAATAGIPDVNVKNIDNDAASASGTVTFPAGTLPSTTSTLSANVVLISAQTVTAAAGVTFPTSIASPTNITAGTITTVTNLTNAPTNGDFTSTMKTSIQTATTAVTQSADVKLWLGVAPNALISGRVDANANAAIATVTVSADVLKWNGTLVSAPATAGIPDVNVKNIDNDAASASGTVTFPAGTLPSTTSTMSANVVGLSAAGITAEQNAVWDALIASHLGAGTTGAALSAAGGAGDPWITPIPGAYAAGQAGFLLGYLMDHTTLTVSANTVSINAVSTSAVTTVKAVQGLTTADTITTVTGNVNGNVGGNVTGTVGSVVGAVGSVTGNVGGNVAGSVGSLTTNNDKTGYALSSAGNDAAADAFLLRDLATGASASSRNVQNTFRAIRNKTTLSGSTFSVFEENDVTPAWTAITTTTSAMSITSVDPA